jgi:hypothetical protein
MLVELFLYDPTLASVLNSLSIFSRVFLLFLVLVGAYTLYFVLVVLVRLHFWRTAQNDNSFRKALAVLNHRSANLRQIIVSMFFLFGLTFFLEIQNAFWTADNNRPVGPMILENFRAYFRYGAAIFLVFLVLHSVQWFISGRICTAALRLDAQISE